MLDQVSLPLTPWRSRAEQRSPSSGRSRCDPSKPPRTAQSLGTKDAPCGRWNLLGEGSGVASKGAMGAAGSPRALTVTVEEAAKESQKGIQPDPYPSRYCFIGKGQSSVIKLEASERKPGCLLVACRWTPGDGESVSLAGRGVASGDEAGRVTCEELLLVWGESCSRDPPIVT